MEPITAVPRHRYRRWILLAAAIAALGAGGWFGYRWWARPTPTTYTTQGAEKTGVGQSVTATGTLNPVVQVQVGSQVSGRIKDLGDGKGVDYNDHVTRGQVLAHIDPAVFQ